MYIWQHIAIFRIILIDTIQKGNLIDLLSAIILFSFDIFFVYPSNVYMIFVHEFNSKILDCTLSNTIFKLKLIYTMTFKNICVICLAQKQGVFKVTSPLATELVVEEVSPFRLAVSPLAWLEKRASTGAGRTRPNLLLSAKEDIRWHRWI